MPKRILQNSAERVQFEVLLRDDAGQYLQKAVNTLKQRKIDTLTMEVNAKGVRSPSAKEIMGGFQAALPPHIHIDLDGPILVLRTQGPKVGQPSPAACKCSCGASGDCDGSGGGG